MKYIVLMLSLFLAWQVEASVLINEIMYDPIGPDANHEWIELVNTGTDPVDITGWKLFEANSNHGLTVSRGTFVIPQNGFIIIADNGPQFIVDNPSYSGSVLDSAFSFNNTGEIFEIRNNALVMQDSLSYSSSIGASENSATLTRTSSGSWIEGTATPGTVNNETPYSNGGSGGQNTGSGGSGNNSSGSGSSSGTSSGNAAGGNFATGIKKETVKKFEPYYRLSLVKDKEIVTVATPVSFNISAEYVEPRGTTQIISGVTYVSFGDGTKTVLKKITPLVHEWQRAGTYTVVITYKSSELFSKPFVTIKEVVTVTNPNLVLSVDESDNVVIENLGDDTLDISNWYITQGVHDMQLPPETYIEHGSSLTLSNHLVSYEGASLELLTPSGVSVIDYIKNSEIPSAEVSVSTSNEPIETLSPALLDEIPVQNEKQPIDWLAFVSLLIILVSYCVSRVLVLGTFISFSFVDISESDEIPEEISEGAFFS